jgi:hypothetical protein
MCKRDLVDDTQSPLHPPATNNIYYKKPNSIYKVIIMIKQKKKTQNHAGWRPSRLASTESTDPRSARGGWEKAAAHRTGPATMILSCHVMHFHFSIIMSN